LLWCVWALACRDVIKRITDPAGAGQWSTAVLPGLGAVGLALAPDLDRRTAGDALELHSGCLGLRFFIGDRIFYVRTFAIDSFSYRDFWHRWVELGPGNPDVSWALMMAVFRVRY